MQRYPDVVSYTVDVAAAADGPAEHRHYHEYWSSTQDRVYIKPPVSDEQLEHPYKPSPGVNVMGWNVGGPREGTGVKDFIGPPQLAPNYSFGISRYTPPEQLTSAQLVQQIRYEYHDPAPEKIAQLERQHGLKTIAMVTSSSRAYTISLVGIETEGTGRAYHVRLQPLRDPDKYRLRDLWIDTVTYQTQRARIGGDFTYAATSSVPWMVRFQQVDGATYVSSEVAEAPIAGYRGPMYSSYRVSFSVPRASTLPGLADITPVSEPLLEP